MIFPFTDSTEQGLNKGGGGTFTSIFQAAFIEETTGCYEIIEYGYIKEELFKRDLPVQESVLLSLQDELAVKFNADAVITGTVTKWQNGSWATYPAVGFTATCRLVREPKTLWSISYMGTESFMATENRTPEMAAQKICRKVIDKAIRKGKI